MSAAAAPAWNPLAGVRLRDPMAVGVLCSIVLHVVVMAMRFEPPETLRLAPYDSQIEIVLLNARTEQAAGKPDVLAQANFAGGGDRDEGRARSPLPADTRISDGDALRQTRQRLADLEEQQRKLLALSKGDPSLVASDRSPAPTPPTRITGVDDQNADQVIARLQAQIDRQVSDYNKRPKRLTFGVNALGVSYAQYVDDWASRIERIGTDRYPPQARGRLYDSLVCTVEIDKNGNVVDVIINKRSRHDVLNKAVRQIVYAGAPYARFTAEMARDGDILQIVRTWTFTNEGLATSEVVQGRK